MVDPHCRCGKLLADATVELEINMTNQVAGSD